MDNLFKDVGGTIKTAAKIFLVLGVVSCIIGGASTIGLFPELWFAGLLICVLGPIGVFLSCVFMWLIADLYDEVRWTRMLVAELCQRKAEEQSKIQKEQELKTKKYDNGLPTI
ncbi:MAG: hypothetical protein IJY11_02325 [Clostridia bacterium]|nr:hypothetical protein [Clostridia bacterium]